MESVDSISRDGPDIICNTLQMAYNLRSGELLGFLYAVFPLGNVLLVSDGVAFLDAIYHRSGIFYVIKVLFDKFSC